MKAIDFESPETISQLQNESLKALLLYLSRYSPFYMEHFRKHNIDVSKIQSVSDLTAIPVVGKDDLQKQNMDFLCVDPKNIIEYCTTSGTMGTPVTIALTEKDLQRLAKNEFKTFTSAEITSSDIILLMLSLDRQFMAGIAYYLGARELGAGIIRGGPGNFSMQLEIINRLKPTVLIAVPSFLVGMTAYAMENNIDLNKCSVKKIICIGENIRNEDLTPNALHERICQNWNVQLFSTYASTEQQTAFSECRHGQGGHHHPDFLIFEVLDENGKQLPPKQYGELVITTLGVEGMPLLRYNTGDICAWYDEPCACGKNTARIGPIAGRKQQMIKYKGTTIYPQAIFNILNSMEGIQDYVIDLLSNELGSDDLRIKIALRPGTKLTDTRIKQGLQSALRVVPELTFLSISEVQKMQVVEGKRKIYKLIDLRKS